MKSIYYFIALIMFLSLNANAQVASDTIGCVPLKVQFKSPNASIANPVWDFGDGTSSFILNPVHVYIKQGTYIATLSSNGATIASVTIKIYPKILPAITADKREGCAPFLVKFSNITSLPNGINITNYQWDFGDGDGSILEHPSHTFTLVNDFDISLGITTNIAQCDATTTWSDFIKVLDLQLVSFNIDSVIPTCGLPATAYFSNTSVENLGDTYLWDFGNGITSTQRQPGSVIYSSGGFYEISLSVTNTKGCVSVVSRELRISDELTINVIVPSSLCAGKPFSIEKNRTIGDAYFWQFESSSTSTDREPNDIVFTSEGAKEIYFSVTNANGCMADTTFIVNVEDPIIDFTTDPLASCLFEPTFVLRASDDSFKKYLWNDKNGASVFNYSFPSVKRDSFYYNSKDSLLITLEAITAAGCIARVEKKVLHQLPNAQFRLNTFEGEVPYLLEVYDESKSIEEVIRWTYIWGDGSSDTYDENTIGDASHLYEVPGRYYVNLSILTVNGCEDKYYGAWVEAHAPLRPNTPGPSGTCTPAAGSYICYKDTLNVIITNIPKEIDAANISMGQTLSHCEEITSFTYHVLEDPGMHDVLIAMENGGKFYEFQQGLVIHGAKAVLGYEVDCSGNHTVLFTNKSINATNIKWILNGEEVLLESFNYTFPKAGDYEVTLIAENYKDQCRPDTVTKTIYIRDLDAIITTDLHWCADVYNKLISTSSKDKITGCRLGSLWSFPKELEVPHIQTDLDTASVALIAGTHQIRLIVRDINGCLDTAFQTIEVHQINASFETDRETVCAGSTIKFTDSSQHDAAIETYKWNILPDLNQKDITHKFDTIGDKYINIVLHLTDIYGCQNTTMKRMETYIPETKITFDSIICKDLEKTFFASDYTIMGSSLNFNWLLDGNEVSTDSIMMVHNLTSDIKKVTLQIEEKATTCKNEYELEFRIIDPPQAIIKGIMDSIYCHPKNLLMLGDSSKLDSFDKVRYFWSINNTFFSNKVNPIATFKKGMHTIDLKVVSTYGCESEASKSINLVGPEGEILVDKNQVCKGENITFTMTDPIDVNSFYWDFGQGEVSHNTSPVLYNYQNVPLNGSTFASLVLSSNETGCEYIVSVPIKVFVAQADFKSDTTCHDTLRIINLSLGDNLYKWSYNGNHISDDELPLVKFDNPGTYPIVLTILNNQYGCRDTIQKNLVFLTNPTLDIDTSINLCDDQEFNFKINPQYNYIFYPNNAVTLNDQTVTIKVASDQQILVQVTAMNGCIIEKTLNVQHNKLYNSYTVEEFLVCQNEISIPLTIRDLDGDVLIWTLNGSPLSEDYFSCTGCNKPILIKPISGLLEAKITNKIICDQPTFGFGIINADIQVPNVFSPNGDEVNDVFRPVLLTKDVPDLVIENLRVINRWGKEIYNSNLPWDGNVTGVAAPAEVYSFILSYSNGAYCHKTVSGDVTLMR